MCLGTFLTYGVTQTLPLETKLQLMRKRRDVAWTVSNIVKSPATFLFFNDYILPFTAAVTKCYDLACQLCSFTFLDVCGFWIWVLVIEFLFEWQACTIYTVFRRLFLNNNFSKLISATLEILYLLLCWCGLTCTLVWACRLIFILCWWNLFCWLC